MRRKKPERRQLGHWPPARVHCGQGPLMDFRLHRLHPDYAASKPDGLALDFLPWPAPFSAPTAPPALLARPLPPVAAASLRQYRPGVVLRSISPAGRPGRIIAVRRVRLCRLACVARRAWSTVATAGRLAWPFPFPAASFVPAVPARFRPAHPSHPAPGSCFVRLLAGLCATYRAIAPAPWIRSPCIANRG